LSSIIIVEYKLQFDMHFFSLTCTVSGKLVVWSGL